MTCLSAHLCVSFFSIHTNHGARVNTLTVGDKQLRRTMQTMLLGYPALRERLGPSKVILNPIFQEVNALPCDTGSVSAL